MNFEFLKSSESYGIILIFFADNSFLGGNVLKQRNPSEIQIQDTNLFVSNVPFEELKKCCNDFNDQIGKGGFTEVYKGRRNGNDIAVKRIRRDLRINEESYLRIINQFIVELQAVHTFPAENILLLLAYSFTEDLSTQPCLVYQVSSIQLFTFTS